ncbi:hypothetical protein GCM10009540_82970 [Streptomyces turgidiscabies]
MTLDYREVMVRNFVSHSETEVLRILERPPNMSTPITALPPKSGHTDSRKLAYTHHSGLLARGDMGSTAFECFEDGIDSCERY